MKRLLVVVLVLVVLAAAGFAAYRSGLIDRFTGAATSGDSSSAAAMGGPGSPGGDSGGSSSTATDAPGAATGDAAPPPATSDAAPSLTTSGAAPLATGTPIPPGLVAVAQPGQPISNKAIELRVTNHSIAPSIGGQTAADGRAFVIIDTAWKSLIPPQKVNRKKASDRSAGMGSLGFGGGATAQDKADDEANTTIEQVPFEMGPMTNHVWLIADGRYAEMIAVDATKGIDGHVSTDTLKIPGFEKVVSGGIAFEAPADAQALALLVLDSKNGHMLVPIKGAPPVLTSSLGGASRSNEFVDLALAGTSWLETAAAQPGTKTLVATLRGISRKDAIVDIPFGEFSFLQTEKGCVVQPDEGSPAASRPLAPMGRFVPFVPREGQLAFTVPADTQSAMLLLRLRGQAAIDLPVLGDGSVRKPPFLATHEDGNVLRVHVVGTGAPPAGLSPPREGLEHLVVDFVVENLTTGSGLELQLAPQFALADGQGTKYEPDPASHQLPCRLTGANVVPAGSWRRFSLLYSVPPGQPLTLQYRGFESTGSLKVR